jgi:hypothetical protein
MWINLYTSLLADVRACKAKPFLWLLSSSFVVSALMLKIRTLSVIELHTCTSRAASSICWQCYKEF